MYTKEQVFEFLKQLAWVLADVGNWRAYFDDENFNRAKLYEDIIEGKEIADDVYDNKEYFFE